MLPQDSLDAPLGLDYEFLKGMCLVTSRANIINGGGCQYLDDVRFVLYGN